MNRIKIEIKWAVIFSIAGLIWMVLEKVSGLHSTYIDYHLYLTNLFTIPAILMMVLALKDKKKNFYKTRFLNINDVRNLSYLLKFRMPAKNTLEQI